MIPDAPTDAELLARFRRQTDRGALSLLFERHRGLAYRVALGVVRNPADAEDAVQDAFLNLLAYEPRVRPEASLAGLVARMALRAGQRLARSAGRRRAREAAWALPEDAAANAAFDHVAERETHRAVRQAVDALDDRYRLPVLLHYVEGLSTQETAEALGISRTAVTTRLSRAVGKLREHLKREGVVVAAPMLAALLPGEGAQAAPVSLATRLESLAASAPAGVSTAAGVAAGVSAVPLLGKAAVAAFVVAVSLGGAATVRRLPPPPPAGATAPTPAPLHESAITAPVAPGADTTARAVTKPDGDGPGTGTPPAPTGQPRVGVDRVSTRASRRQPSLNATHPWPTAPPASPPPRLPVSRGQVAASAHPPVSGGPASGRPGDAAAPDPAPTRAAATGTPAMTREQERGLAIRILHDAWRESEDTGYSSRGPLLALLAQADLEVAAPLIEPLRGQWASYGRYCTVRSFSLTDPEEALARVRGGEPDLDFLVPTARWYAERRLPGTEVVLERLLAGVRALPMNRASVTSLASCAAIAAKTGDPRALQLVTSVREMVPALLAETPAAEQGGVLYTIATLLAPADLDAALEIEARNPDALRHRFSLPGLVRASVRRHPAKARVAVDTTLAEMDPAAAMRDSSSMDWARTAILVVEVLAPDDPAGMEALARRIPLENERAVALAAVARHLPADRAATLREEAMALVSKPGLGLQNAQAAARIAEAFPPGSGRRHACALALDALGAPTDYQPAGAPSLAPSNVETMAHAAFLLAPTEPEAAAALLEDALNCLRKPRTRLEAQCMQEVARAFCALDPVRAVEVARAIPETYPDARFTACQQIAEHLLASPEARASVRFREWHFVEETPSGKGERRWER